MKIYSLRDIKGLVSHGLPVVLLSITLLASSSFPDDAAPPLHIASSPSELFYLYDLNKDGALSRPELYLSQDRSQLSVDDRPLTAEQEWLFQDTDSDCDGLLTNAEVRFLKWRGRELGAAAARRHLEDQTWPLFKELDKNNDAQLTRTEWLSGDIPAGAEWSYEFRLCDFDQNGSLSFNESLCSSRYGVPSLRTGVPDPLRAEMERVLNLSSPIDPNSECPQQTYDPSSIHQKVEQELPYLKDYQVAQWDQNGDGKLDRREVQFGLEVAYGMRLTNGLPLRPANGQVFNFKTFGYMDLDHNQELSEEEFRQKYWRKDQVAETLQNVDLNQDKTLTLQELNMSNREHLLWIDSLTDFRRFDQDSDVRISPAELVANARSFEANLATQLFPGFDLNRDGYLSFYEYRGTAVATPVHDWNWVRWDTDFDTFLSLEEFHSPKNSDVRGVTQYFINVLDKNHDDRLSLDEYSFQLTWSHVAPADAFAALDLNHDGELLLPEFLSSFAKPAEGEDQVKTQARLAKLENAFNGSDDDQNSKITGKEYVNPRASIAAAVGGRTVAVQLRRPAVSPNEWNWRTTGLIAINILLFGGLGLFAYRKFSGNRSN